MSLKLTKSKKRALCRKRRKQAIKDGSLCGICLEPTLERTKCCGGFFHPSCLEEWEKHKFKRICPICRKDYLKIYLKEKKVKIKGEDEMLFNMVSKIMYIGGAGIIFAHLIALIQIILDH